MRRSRGVRAVRAVSRGRLALASQVLFHRSLVKGVGIALLDADGILGAFTQAGPQAVAEVIGSQHRLAVDDLDGPLGAGGNTQAATVALVRVDLHNFSQHVCLPFV